MESSKFTYHEREHILSLAGIWLLVIADICRRWWKMNVAWKMKSK